MKANGMTERRKETQSDADYLISEPEAAKRIGVSDSYMRNCRLSGKPLLPYIRVGARCKYEPSVIEEFKRKNTVKAEK